MGDRRQEIVFIGQGLNPEAVTKLLDACLANEAEMLAAELGQLSDPLFGEEEEEEEEES